MCVCRMVFRIKSMSLGVFFCLSICIVVNTPIAWWGLIDSWLTFVLLLIGDQSLIVWAIQLNFPIAVTSSILSK